MTDFNWRTVSKNTLRSYTLAARDFEAVTCVPVQSADVVSLAAYRASMEGRRLNVNTIRKRLSIVSIMSGVKVELPKRQKVERPFTLNADQVKALMAVVTNSRDRILLVRLLTLGMNARTTDSMPESFAAHFVGTQSEKSMSAQELTRKLKRYAGKAGLDERQISLRVWCLTGRRLMNSLGAIELVNVISHNPEPSGIDWHPLHGIGRRRKSLSV